MMNPMDMTAPPVVDPVNPGALAGPPPPVAPVGLDAIQPLLQALMDASMASGLVIPGMTPGPAADPMMTAADPMMTGAGPMAGLPPAPGGTSPLMSALGGMR